MALFLTPDQAAELEKLAQESPLMAEALAALRALSADPEVVALARQRETLRLRSMIIDLCRNLDLALSTEQKEQVECMSLEDLETLHKRLAEDRHW